MILKEFNIFKKKAKEEPLSESADDFEFLTSTPTKENQNIELIEEVKSQKSLSKYMSSTKLDWSDNETISDLTETTTSSTKHLNSPKHKINKANHYAVQNFKYESTDITECQSKTLSNLKPSSSKNSLINRFLRNVTLKKIMDLKQQKKCKYSRRCMGLYVKGVQVKAEVNYNLDRQIEDEILNGRAKIYNSKTCFDPKMLFKVRNEIFRDKMETLIKIFPVHSAYTTSGESKALSLFLTNTTLYICSSKSDNRYSNHFVLPYSELNTILIGPNAQTIHISNYDKDMQCIITTGCGNITGDIVGQIEMTMRRDKNKPKLPAVKQLTMRDMVNLRRAICKQTSVDKEEEYFHYSIVRLQEFNTEIHDTPLGPNKEGPLMFKISETEARWETAYFILKAGVLYMLSSPSHRVPMRVLPLINGACQGARRIYNYPRPHTFQLVIGHTMLHLAAPDEYVASDWLQALVHAASGGDSFPLSTIPETDSINRKCVDAYNSLQNAWPLVSYSPTF
ncbi:pleckstrin y domain-containing family m member 2 [Holotrichia oblita]|uniref:Pleckstrin y domain-containing family m member 2 n=1 Tax=Holotrichia oblita TaxID=644536 RepID=A0ACB9TEW7_HOLOL|nr:pleckstrin y domain-containing family m member 2 [Holotrichia oblita]